MSSAKQAAVVGTAAAAVIPAAVVAAAAVATPAHAAEIPPAALDVHAVRVLPAARNLVTKITQESTGKTVTIASGDTLSGIAQRFCDTPADWTGIWQQNKAEIADPNLIYPGQVLRFTCEELASLLSAAAPAVSAAPVTTASPDASSSGDVTQASQPQSSASYGEVNPADFSGFEACVIARESGGDSQVMNSTGHYGLFQFDLGTWEEGGGNPADFGHASVAEQEAVFASVYAQRGAEPWAPSDGC